MTALEEKMPSSLVRDSAAFKVQAGKRILPFAKHGNTSIAYFAAPTQVQCRQVRQMVKTPQPLVRNLTAPLQREIGKLREPGRVKVRVRVRVRVRVKVRVGLGVRVRARVRVPGHGSQAFVSDAYAVIKTQVTDTSTVHGYLVK